MPVYVQAQGALIGKSGDQLEIKQQGSILQKVRLMEISHVSMFGNVQVTAQALQELCDRNIPICHFSFGGWFRGITTGMSHKNVELRRSQYGAATNPESTLSIARQLVFGKIKNCRTLMRRNHEDPPAATLAELDRLAKASMKATSTNTLLGLEGIGCPDLLFRISRHDQIRGHDFQFPWTEPATSPRPRQRYLIPVVRHPHQTSDGDSTGSRIRPVLGVLSPAKVWQASLGL